MSRATRLMTSARLLRQPDGLALELFAELSSLGHDTPFCR
jgi:hypothetical protein